MKNSLRLDVSPRAAAVVVALALLASVVTGGEKTAPPDSPPVSARNLEREHAAEFDPATMMRRPREGEIEDLFANRAASAAPAPVAAVQPASPAPPPAAPALPFTYLGHMSKRDKLTVFVVKSGIEYSIAAGDVLENAYRVESADAHTVVFTYLPLGERQTLQVPPPQ